MVNLRVFHALLSLGIIEETQDNIEQLGRVFQNIGKCLALGMLKKSLFSDDDWSHKKILVCDKPGLNVRKENVQILYLQIVLIDRRKSASQPKFL